MVHVLKFNNFSMITHECLMLIGRLSTYVPTTLTYHKQVYMTLIVLTTYY